MENASQGQLQTRVERVQTLTTLAIDLRSRAATAADKLYGSEPEEGGIPSPADNVNGGLAHLDHCLDNLERELCGAMAQVGRMGDL